MSVVDPSIEPLTFVFADDGLVPNNPMPFLVYKGAVDNSPDGEGESPQPDGAKLVNYVEQALAEIAEGKPVSVPSTKPYGCSVKYGS